MTKTTAEELARVICKANMLDQYNTVDPEALENEWVDWIPEAQAILASPVIAKIERDAEMQAIAIARKTMQSEMRGLAMESPYRAGIRWGIERSIDAIEAGEHKEKAGG